MSLNNFKELESARQENSCPYVHTQRSVTDIIADNSYGYLTEHHLKMSGFL